MLRQLSLNEQRVQTLNRMRGGYYTAEQRLNQNRVKETPVATTDDRWMNDQMMNQQAPLDPIKLAAETMYDTTGDVMWLTF